MYAINQPCPHCGNVTQVSASPNAAQLTRQLAAPAAWGIGLMALIGALALAWVVIVTINLATFAHYWHN